MRLRLQLGFHCNKSQHCGSKWRGGLGFINFVFFPFVHIVQLGVFKPVLLQTLLSVLLVLYLICVCKAFQKSMSQGMCWQYTVGGVQSLQEART